MAGILLPKQEQCISRVKISGLQCEDVFEWLVSKIGYVAVNRETFFSSINI